MSDVSQIVKILLSSPGNLSEDRKIARRVIDQINLDSGRRDGYRVECVGWDTHTRPAIGTYPQDVINEQLPQDIDIFVGLMGAYFGTPTPNWGSGTEEEFRIAHKNFLETGSPEICFYFSEASPSLMNIDPSQLSKRQNFMKELPELGVLYWTYEDSMTFQFDLRRHLSSAIQEALAKRPTNTRDSVPVIAESLRDLPNYDDLLISSPLIAAEDLLVEAASWLKAHLKAQEMLTSDCKRLAHNLNKTTNKMNANSVNPSPQVAQKLFVEFTGHLSTYQKHLRKYIPEMKKCVENSMSCLQRSVEILLSEGLEDQMPIAGVFQPLRGFRKALKVLRESVEGVNAEMGIWGELPLDAELQMQRVVALHADLLNYITRACNLIDEFLAEYGRA